MSNSDMTDMPMETLAETANYTIWSAEEPDGETTYHVELGAVTAHFFTEEWTEFVQMILEADSQNTAGDDEDIEVELDWGALYFAREEWTEFVDLIKQV